MSNKNIYLLSRYFKENGITQLEVARKLGVSKQYISNILNGRVVIGKGIAARLSLGFGISQEWILTGEGEMLRPKEEGEVLKVPLQAARLQQNTNSPGAVNLAEHATYNNYSSPKGIRLAGVSDGVRPIVPTGLCQQKNVDVYTEVKKMGQDRVEFFSFIPEFPDTDMYMRMQDDSMMPHLERGDILALAALDEKTYIMNGNIYALDTYRMGLFVRVINDHGDSYECQTYAEQSRYHTFSVPKSDVIRVFRITGMFRPCV